MSLEIKILEPIYILWMPLEDSRNFNLLNIGV